VQPTDLRPVLHGHHSSSVEEGVHFHPSSRGQLSPVADTAAEWVAEIDNDDGDFRGPAVQGRKGERFVYLTWGTVAGDTFSMFRRAKLMLADLPSNADEVTVDVDLTDESGMPRCARLRPPALRIS
jgi:hypothetical protein